VTGIFVVEEKRKTVCGASGYILSAVFLHIKGKKEFTCYHPIHH